MKLLVSERTDRLVPADAFGFLVGVWRIEREVHGQIAMVGTAEIRATGTDVAEYRERVVVKLADGAAFSGSQRYRVQRAAEGFELRFADTGALFQDLRFTCEKDGGLRATAIHVCGEDRYASEYVLGPRRWFSIRHSVVGPRKDYLSTTQFREISQGV